MSQQLNTPILLIGFNRPDTTEKVFEEIRKAKPKKLFVHIDGPRNDEEKIKTDAVKKIFQRVDWPCELKTLYRPKNIGITSILGAYEWFFDNVSEGIILEDDAVPTQDFFRFCSEILKKYRNDERIMYLSGCNFQHGWARTSYSYYFSKYPYTYGFATWRRAWKKYDYQMKTYPELKEKGFFSDIFPDKLERFYVMREMDNAFYKNPNAIDTRWWFTILSNNGLTIVPNKNLVTNIGFGKDAAHTKEADSFLSVPSQTMDFPIKDPSFVVRDRKSDKRYAHWILRRKLKKNILSKLGLKRSFS